MIWESFGIDPVEQLLQERRDKFSKKYGRPTSENMLYPVVSRY